MFRLVLGIAVILAGIVLAVWLGLWICFVGGIVDVVEAFLADSFPALAFAIGVVKVVCASFVGWCSFMISVVLGGGIIATAK